MGATIYQGCGPLRKQLTYKMAAKSCVSQPTSSTVFPCPFSLLRTFANNNDVICHESNVKCIF